MTATYPLQAEEAAALTKLLEDQQVKVAECREHFKQRRDSEFPGWHEEYLAQFNPITKPGGMVHCDWRNFRERV